MAYSTNSSGDLQADRRFAMAMQFYERGDHEAAADLLAQAQELAPAWPPLPFRLGEALMAAGRETEAVAAFQDYLRLDPADALGAAIKLALLGAAPVPDTLPADYVETLFDDYAARFDSALVGRLSYRAPQLLAAAVEKARPAQGAAERVLDLGCGTGLSGAAFRSRASWLEGIDLSARMISEAMQKGLYDRLHQGDILATLPVAGAQYYDLVLAADVLVYIGGLERLFTAVRAVLAPEGIFAFTTQRAEAERDFMLGADHRYAHSAAYLRSCATQAGLACLSMDTAILRRDGIADVEGYIGVFRAA